ncbi:MAG: sigma 54-interacting transcriptional regulator [Candidatus Cloacimonetes bacterium]|nr:sigma 54-interacting transcriptional regulator [Candidatus Cloacimonadota bacterium]
MRKKNFDKDAQDKLGQEYFQKGNLEKAVDCFKKNLISTNQLTSEEIVKYLRNIGLCYLKMNKFKKAQKYLFSAIEICEREDLHKHKASSLQYLGLTYYWLGNYSKALEFYNRALNLFDEKKDKAQIAALLEMIGMLKKELGDLSGALEFLLKALKKKEQLGNAISIGTSFLNIGVIYYSLKNNKNAEEFYQKALNSYQEVDHKHGIAQSLTNMGNVFTRNKNFKRALDCYEQALEISEMLNDKFTIGNILNNMGRIYQKKEENVKALELYLQALKIKQDLGNSEGIILCLLSIGNVQIKTGEYNKALKNFRQSLELARKNNNKINICKNYKFISDVYEKMENYKKANENLKLYLELNNEIYNEESQKKIAEMQTKYETEKKEKEAEIYRLKNIELGKKNKKIKKQKEILQKANEDLRKSEIKYNIVTAELNKNIGMKLIGNSDSMNKIKELINVICHTDNTNILIIGESGTGKEIVAKQIHQLSKRQKNNFYGVNSSAIPESLFESEFFGHEKNAFTGANNTHIGWFEVANSGTLFLDEIGTMSLDQQVKLLRVLEERKIVRIGSHKEIPIDIRIISATNIDLYKKVNLHKFRDDLYHRLSTFVIQIPPLRQRKEDIPLLLEHFVKIFGTLMNKRINKIEKNVSKALTGYDFPGNVRELKNIVERAIIVSDSSTLKLKHFAIPQCEDTIPTDSEIITLAEMEKDLLLRALHKTGFNKNQAAKLLGVERRVVFRKMIKYGIEKEEK